MHDVNSTAHQDFDGMRVREVRSSANPPVCDEARQGVAVASRWSRWSTGCHDSICRDRSSGASAS